MNKYRITIKDYVTIVENILQIFNTLKCPVGIDFLDMNYAQWAQFTSKYFLPKSWHGK